MNVDPYILSWYLISSESSYSVEIFFTGLVGHVLFCIIIYSDYSIYFKSIHILICEAPLSLFSEAWSGFATRGAVNASVTLSNSDF